MILPPKIELYGDTEKATALKGKALGFFQFVCQQMGDALSLVRIKQDESQGYQIQAYATKNAYGDITGIVKIFVIIESTEQVYLYCTSFNAGIDLGTLIYKAPYPPYTEGGLIDAGSNPDYLILPTPTYKSRTNYWVDEAEKNTVSWAYVNTKIGITNYRHGKIAIQGIETSSSSWGLFLEPLCCGLISDTQLVVIYRDRTNYSGTGTTRYFAVYDYQLDFANERISLTFVSRFNLSTYGFNTKPIIGILDDRCQTVIYADSGSLKYFVVENDYLAIASNNNLIWQNQPTASYSVASTGDSSDYTVTKSLINPVCNFVGLIDVRGNTVSFCIEQMDTRELLTNTFQNGTGDVLLKDYDDRAYSFFVADWTPANGLNTQLSETSNYSRHTDGVKIFYNGDYASELTSVTNSMFTSLYFYASKPAITVCQKTIDSSVATGSIHLGGSYYDDSAKSTATTTSVTIYANNIEIANGNSLSNNWTLMDVSYTQGCCLLAFAGTSNCSCVLDLQKNSYVVLLNELTTLSVTNL